MHRTPPITQSQTRPQPWALPSSAYRLETLAEHFAPISLKEMDSVALLNRIDTKFIMSSGQLLQALAAIRPDYRMLSVNSQRINHYRTLYFDTPNFDLYHLHVNKRADIYKVRSREYTDSRLAFLEVKHKNHKGRTIKERIATAEPILQMNTQAEGWLHSVYPFDSQSLQPKIWNTFSRLTLVSKTNCERVTLDVDLTFYTQDQIASLDGIAIAEVKMDSGRCRSPFLAQMHAQRIHPRGFSKYCIGVSMLYGQVKKNAMKPKLLRLEKIMKGTAAYE